MSFIQVPPTLLIGPDGDYTQFEDVLLSQELDMEELQKFYLQRKSELAAAGKAVSMNKSLGSFKNLYASYGAPDTLKGTDEDIFLGEREGVRREDDDEEESGDEYETDVEDADSSCDAPCEAERVYRLACRRLRVVPCSAVRGHLNDHTLRLDHRAMTSHEVKALALGLVYNTSLTTLYLSDNAIGARGIRHITGALLHHDRLTHLDLSHNNLGSSAAECICELIKTSGKLTHLSAAGNRFIEGDGKQFSNAIQISKSLREIDLSHNEFREEGGKFFGIALAKCPLLEVLNLSWNHLRLKGAEAIAKGVETNTKLRTLDLSWNGFANDGAKSVALALKVNSCLRDLDLSCNRINLEGAIGLAEALKINSTLICLKLSRNPITTSGACHLLAVLRTSETAVLNTLELLDVDIDPQFEWLLEEVQSLRQLRVIHGGHVSHGDPFAKRKKRESTFLGDPLSLMMEFVKKSGLRLFDLYAQLDKDNSMSVTRQEFKRGMKSVKVPLNEHQIEKLIDQLDLDRDGEISFSEFLEGQKRYRERERKKAAGLGSRRPSSVRPHPPDSRPTLHSAMSRVRPALLTAMTGALGGHHGTMANTGQQPNGLTISDLSRHNTLSIETTNDVITTSVPVPSLARSQTK